jgi:hypothetical protein
MERDDKHEVWVWSRDPEPDRPERDEDGRATARDAVQGQDDAVTGEVSPLVSLWRSALGAVQDAHTRSCALTEHELDELDELEVRPMAWGDARATDNEPN